MTNVHIFGDSWSYRSFQKLPDFKEVFGTLTFQHLFQQQDILATNHSQQSSSNQQTIKNINSTKFGSNDVVIVFQTDPLRDIFDRKEFRQLGDPVVPNQTLRFVAEQRLQEFYQKLSTIDQSIVLIGGLSCLAHDLIPPTIITMEKSWTELVSPGFQDCYFEWQEFAELVHDVVKCSDDFTPTRRQIQTKNGVWQNSDAFGWCHPSDLGYTLMFDNLIRLLNSKELL